MSGALVTAERFDAALFDLDGVVTDTARIHALCWKRVFDDLLERRAKARGETFRPFDPGIRATPEEGFPVHERGTYLSGFYETWPIVYGEEAHGFAKQGQTMLCVPDGTLLKLYVDDDPFELGTARIVSFERALDLRAGALDREVVFETFDRKRLAVRSRRFASLDHRHLACIRYEVEVVDGEADVTISSELVAPDHVPGHEGDPRSARRLDERPLVPTDHRARERRILMKRIGDSRGRSRSNKARSGNSPLGSLAGKPVGGGFKRVRTARIARP